MKIPSVRPKLEDRKFTSKILELEIKRISELLKITKPVTDQYSDDDRFQNVSTLFENCWPNTLDTTVVFHSHTNGSTSLSDSFIITGDIPAMWLRDSTNQIVPYLSLLSDPSSLEIHHLFQGLVNRQAKCILTHPYSNAFYKDKTAPKSHWDADKVFPPRPIDSDIPIHESKYELDSLCAFLKISNSFYESASISEFKSFPHDQTWLNAVKLTLETMRIQQRGTSEELEQPAYTFVRGGNVPTDTLMLEGRGPPAKRCGLIKSMFRPSDDCTTLPFHIPSNAMAVVELKILAHVLESSSVALDLAKEARDLANEVEAAIEKFGKVTHKIFGEIYAYEVDGFGSAYLMDDANIPSLLSLPYLGFTSMNDPLYLRTRSFVLSDSNPYFFKGTVGQGIGGPHVGLGWIWPMSLIMQGLTTTDINEIETCISVLLKSAETTGFMHESFWKDNPEKFTRAWFSWANGLFGELTFWYLKIRKK